MRGKTARIINVQSRIDPRTLATILTYFEREMGVYFGSMSGILHASMEELRRSIIATFPELDVEDIETAMVLLASIGVDRSNISGMGYYKAIAEEKGIRLPDRVATTQRLKQEARAHEKHEKLQKDLDRMAASGELQRQADEILGKGDKEGSTEDGMRRARDSGVIADDEEEAVESTSDPEERARRDKEEIEKMKEQIELNIERMHTDEKNNSDKKD